MGTKGKELSYAEKALIDELLIKRMEIVLRVLKNTTKRLRRAILRER